LVQIWLKSDNFKSSVLISLSDLKNILTL
jgi:hypothetical protein